MTRPPRPPCDGCCWLRTWPEDRKGFAEARCGWKSLALISHAWRAGDPRPDWCDLEQEPAT